MDLWPFLNHYGGPPVSLRQLTSHQPPPTALWKRKPPPQARSPPNPPSTPSFFSPQTKTPTPSFCPPPPRPCLPQAGPSLHPSNKSNKPASFFLFHAFHLLHSPARGCFGAKAPHCREPFGLLLFPYGIRCDSNEHDRKAVTRGNVRRLDFRSNDLEAFHVLIIPLCCSLSKLKLNLNLLNPTISM